MEIGKQIKRYRMEMGLSQEELSEKVFVSRQSISNWENNKNYPDMKSLLLLSSIFNVSLDILVKGDLEDMKEQIKAEDISEKEVSKFNNDRNIFAIFLLLIIVLPVPLMKLMGILGVFIYVVIAIIGLYYAIRVEKHKKKFNIQTYKEIIAFVEGKKLDNIEKNQEFGKRPYQKFILVIGVGLIALIVSVILGYILL